jgi:hypothetical protein
MSSWRSTWLSTGTTFPFTLHEQTIFVRTSTRQFNNEESRLLKLRTSDDISWSPATYELKLIQSAIKLESSNLNYPTNYGIFINTQLRFGEISISVYKWLTNWLQVLGRGTSASRVTDNGLNYLGSIPGRGPRPDQLWGPSSLLSNMHIGPFMEIKRQIYELSITFVYCWH